MTKRVVVAVAGLASLLVFTAPLVGQTGFGIKGGVSFGNISNKGVLPGSLKNRTGFAAGVAVGLGGMIGVGAEALYAQRGATSSGTTSTAESRLDYIDIPAYLRLSSPGTGLRVFGYAGPQFSKEVRCKNASAGDCLKNTGRSTTDFAGIIGGGVRFGKSAGFTVEGRYIYGLKDLKINTVTSSDSYKTRSFVILAGIAI